MDRLQDLNYRISECERLKSMMHTKEAQELQDYIDWVERVVIPQEKIYDV